MKMNTLFLRICFAVILGLSAKAQKLNTTLTYSINQPTIKTDKPPVLIMLHGYGSDENDLLELAKGIDGRFITFSLRAPNARQGAGYCWYDLQFLSDGTFKYDYEQVKQSRAKILAFISEACRVYKSDSTRVYLMGFSQGAIMSYELAFFAPKKVKGLLLLSGRLMNETRLHKSKAGDLAKLSFYVGHGATDDVIRIAEAEKATAYLKEKGLTKVSYKTYQMAHSICNAEFEDIKKWLSESLKN
ncbi:MAG: phospholipase [Bacteroidia bacterium]|nr:phospholipase [Bacteroidia bacterium]